MMVLILFMINCSFASENLSHEHGTHFECALPKQAQDVVNCAKEYHPDVLRKKNEVEQIKLSQDVAGQLPNPELDAEVTKGSGGLSNSSVGILQPIEWGGKRSSRIKAAKAQILNVEADLNEIQAEVILSTVTHLHRLRHIEREKKVLESTTQTLEKLISQQASRLNLSPEQQVTLSVYRMALMDSKIKSAEIFDEERALEHYFHISTGHSLAELVPALPEAPLKWPDLDESPNNLDVSPSLLKALAQKNEFTAQSDLSKSATWPELRIGPMWNSQAGLTEPPQSLFGFRIMMDLPVLSWNSSGRAFAQAGVLRGERNISLLRSEEKHERNEQLKIYRSALLTLKAVPQISEIEKDFKRNLSLANRGLIFGPLLIEFHRQRAEFIRSLNARELKAIEALWRIYHFDGRIFSEVL